LNSLKFSHIQVKPQKIFNQNVTITWYNNISVSKFSESGTGTGSKFDYIHKDDFLTHETLL